MSAFLKSIGSAIITLVIALAVIVFMWRVFFAG
jgi:hypothetical protein